MAQVIGWRGYISVDSKVCHGRPCFKGTRVMVADILELMGAGASLREIRSGYPKVTRAHVQAAMRFAREAIESGRYVPCLTARHASLGR